MNFNATKKHLFFSEYAMHVTQTLRNVLRKKSDNLSVIISVILFIYLHVLCSLAIVHLPPNKSLAMA